jgi:hypothetical protein
MHITYIKMKDGREYSGPIHLFRPVGTIELGGYMTLYGCDEKLPFSAMESAVTPDERGGPCDELARAKDIIKQSWERTLKGL